MTNAVCLDIPSVLTFFDADPTGRRHSSAINGIVGEELGFALLIHYFEKKGIRAQKRPEPATSPGARLDGWLEVEVDPPVCYQVEVKSWCMHSYGRTRHAVPITLTGTELADHKRRIWASYWTAGNFRDPKLQKVLIRMRTVSERPVKALACLWQPVHECGDAEPMFEVPVVSSLENSFSRVTVFSMSSYLRNLLEEGCNHVMLDMPDARSRVNVLAGLFRM